MKQENVVPFVTSSRRAMARRGSPDKTLSLETVEVRCLSCGAVLCIESGYRALPDELLCADCRLGIDLDSPGRVDSTG